MINSEELKKKIEELNEPLREHNRITKLSDEQLKDELIGVEND